MQKEGQCGSSIHLRLDLVGGPAAGLGLVGPLKEKIDLFTDGGGGLRQLSDRFVVGLSHYSTRPFSPSSASTFKTLKAMILVR